MAISTPKRYKLFGVDPGLMTGLALVDISDRVNPKPIWALEADTRTFYQTVEQTIEEEPDAIVLICENFLITDRTAKLSQAPWSLMGRGVCEFLTMKYNVPMILQTPGDAKEFSTNDKLHKAGFWHVGGDGHANDAYRHVMKYHADRSPRWTNTLVV